MGNPLSNALEVRTLSKAFGEVQALTDVSFEVPRGSIFGLLGPNGAGKTTLISIILGLAHADSGTVRILDSPSDSIKIRSRVGYVPDVPDFEGWMTSKEYLASAAKLMAVNGKIAERRIPMLLELVDLAGVTTRIGGWSRGMRQRLSIAQALIAAPDLLILDEPTTALDPRGRRDLLDLIKDVSQHATILFSTHLLDDVDRVCDHVLILQNTVVAQSKMDDLRASIGTSLELTLDSSSKNTAERLRREPWATGVVQSGNHIRITTDNESEAAKRIPQIISDAGTGLIALNRDQPTMEEIFLGLVGDGRG